MNWEAIGAIGEILGAVGVLATLIYLSQQIRKSAEDTRNNTVFAVMSLLSKNRRAAMNSGIAELVIRAEKGEQLTDTETRQLVYYEQSSLQDFEAAYTQYLAGTLDEEIMGSMNARLIAFMSQDPNFDEKWAVNRYYFTESFADYLDELRKTTH